MKRRQLLKHITLASAGLCLFRAHAEKTRDNPNIIFILADDMGFGDVRILNPASKIPTPNLDNLAKEGMRFTDAHTPAAVCTPTRYGIITGRYCWRTSKKKGVLNGYSRHLIEPDRTTVASLLKSAGYNTGAVGKWHLGMDWSKREDDPKQVDFSLPVKNGPIALGFDYFYGVHASLDMEPYTYIKNDHVVELPTEEQKKKEFPAYLRKGAKAPGFKHEECLDHLLSEAAGFIKKNTDKTKPFFLYFAMTAPHKPVLPHKRFRNRTRLGPYGDFIVQVDWTVGQILNTVKQTGIEDNTIIFYTSDNGSFMFNEKEAQDHTDDAGIQGYRPKNHRANHIFRGTKADIWEAGHRVPFFVKWPGRIKPGSVSRETVCLTDFTATAAQIVGRELKKGEAEDSFSMLDVLLARPQKKRRPPVIHHSGGGYFAIRSGKWKLVLASGSGGREKPKGRAFEKPYHLFDMEKDPGETNNLINQYPEIADRLEIEFNRIRN